MALVNCPECGREKVSDTAEHCPFCGYGLREHFETKRKIEEVTMPEKPEEEVEKKRGGCFWCLALLPVPIMFAGEGVGVFLALVYWLVFGLIVHSMAKDEQKDYEKKLADYELAKKNFEEYQKKMVEEQEEKELKKPICPNCGSKETRRVSNFERKLSLQMHGLASDEIGKQYECLKCGRLW